MKVEIFTHPEFEREFKRLGKKYHSLIDDYAQLLQDLENNPLQGSSLGMGVRKLLFGRYLAEWQLDTRFLSSVSAITAHPAFTGIVNMGGNAVPFILKEIERKPSNLVWALNIIFHKKIGDGLSVTEACKLWTAELKK